MDVVRSSMLHVSDSRDMYDGAESRGSMETSHGLSATAPTRARTAEIAGPVAAAAEMGLTAQAALQLASTTWASPRLSRVPRRSSPSSRPLPRVEIPQSPGFFPKRLPLSLPLVHMSRRLSTWSILFARPSPSHWSKYTGITFNRRLESAAA